MPVDMKFVQSSNVESIGYDADSCELHVRFLSAPTVYVYQQVPGDVYERFQLATSKGTFFNSEVKHTYRFYTL